MDSNTNINLEASKTTKSANKSKESRCSHKRKNEHIEKDLTGQVIIVTGANSGIGKETTRVLAKTNATIILACRDATKAIPVVEELKTESQNNNLIFMKLDLSDLKSIEEFAKEFKSKYQRLDVLLNNAGLFNGERVFTKDGFEMTFGTNHLGPFYLTILLLDIIKKSAPSRIVNVSSDLNEYGKMNWDDLHLEKDYGGNTAYMQSKLANVIFTRELQRRLEGTNVKAVCLHPGLILTELNHNKGVRWYERFAISIIRKIARPAAEGAKTTVYCTLEEHEKLVPGAYYSDRKVARENTVALKPENWTRLWNLSKDMIASKIENPQNLEI